MDETTIKAMKTGDSIEMSGNPNNGQPNGSRCDASGFLLLLLLLMKQRTQSRLNEFWQDKMKTALSLTLIVASSVTFGVSAATPPSLSITNVLAAVRVEASGVDPGKWLVVERSTNLVDWVEVRSYHPASSVFAWTEVRRPGAAFYRLIQDPGPQSRVAASAYQAMQSAGVPGVSITVITNGQISWARGFGLLAKGRPEPVDTNTLFQAASISKAVTALAAMRMVESGVLSLDEPVNQKLTSIAVPGRNGTNVTLRHILSHTGGFPFDPRGGYAVGSPIPTALQVLQGEPPSNTPAVAASGPLGTWDYSNGAYVFLQVLMTDVSAKAFPDVMGELVLQPLNMDRSTFEQPLPVDLESNAACAHEGGAVISGRWRVIPEMAAGGLWTTPNDLARMFIAVRRAYLGGAGSIIAQSTAQEMLRLRAVGWLGPWGLGYMLKVDKGVTVAFWHSGSGPGYYCVAFMFLDSGDGVVIMTNSDASLLTTLYNACATVYGWPLDQW